MASEALRPTPPMLRKRLSCRASTGGRLLHLPHLYCSSPDRCSVAKNASRQSAREVTPALAGGAVPVVVVMELPVEVWPSILLMPKSDSDRLNVPPSPCLGALVGGGESPSPPPPPPPAPPAPLAAALCWRCAGAAIARSTRRACATPGGTRSTAPRIGAVPRTAWTPPRSGAGPARGGEASLELLVARLLLDIAPLLLGGRPPSPLQPLLRGDHLRLHQRPLQLLVDNAEQQPQELLRVLLLVTPEGGHQLVDTIEQIRRADHRRLLTAATTAAAAAEQVEERGSESLGHLAAEVGLASVTPASLPHRAVARRRQPWLVERGAAAQVVRERRAVRERLVRLRVRVRVRVRRCACREAQPHDRWRSVRSGQGSGQGGRWAGRTHSAPAARRSYSMCCPARPRRAGRGRRPPPCGARPWHHRACGERELCFRQSSGGANSRRGWGVKSGHPSIGNSYPRLTSGSTTTGPSVLLGTARRLPTLASRLAGVAKVSSCGAASGAALLLRASTSERPTARAMAPLVPKAASCMLAQPASDRATAASREAPPLRVKTARSLAAWALTFSLGRVCCCSVAVALTKHRFQPQPMRACDAAKAAMVGVESPPSSPP
eukprot:scaffold103327_cov55-Phaeocystis_antarctica.AAC.2